ncbi:MAG: peptide chain release factor N(5)-glutamine methyltransferase, partial [Candidatus Hinthialibacter sp.]
MKILEAIEHYSSILESKRVEAPRLSAELLIGHAASLTRSQVLAGVHRVLTSSEQSRLDALIQRRSLHEPIPYITGTVEFYSIPLSISRGVFIPRPETETLVDAALDIAATLDHSPEILDLCTGSGCVLIALALHLAEGRFWGTDASHLAMQVSRANVRRYELQHRVELREGPLFTPLRSEPAPLFDMLVSNPPYIKSGDIPKLAAQIKDFEPVLALDGGGDGMALIRRLLDGAPAVLKPGGSVL